MIRLSLFFGFVFAFCFVLLFNVVDQMLCMRTIVNMTIFFFSLVDVPLALSSIHKFIVEDVFKPLAHVIRGSLIKQDH